LRRQPNVIVIAGPNGAGKSTAAPELLQGPMRVEEFVNADVLAQGLSAFHPEGAAMAAGRIMLARMKELARQRTDFAFETTLASRSFAPWLAGLCKQGYSFRLLYLWLPDANVAVCRVRERVRQGGHDIPDEVIRRRYERSLRNLFDLYLPLAEDWAIYDNSRTPSHLLALGRREEVVTVHDPLTWGKIQERT